MKIKDLIKKLKEIDGNKEIQIVDTNDYEFIIVDISEDGLIWIENKEWSSLILLLTFKLKGI